MTVIQTCKIVRPKTTVLKEFEMEGNVLPKLNPTGMEMPCGGMVPKEPCVMGKHTSASWVQGEFLVDFFDNILQHGMAQAWAR